MSLKVPFSILFCEFLKILSVEFNDIKNSQRKSTKLSESTIKSGFVLILLGCEKLLGPTFRDHFLRFFSWKNEVPQSYPGSFGNGPWSFRTSKNLQKSSNLPLGRPWGFRKKWLLEQILLRVITAHAEFSLSIGWSFSRAHEFEHILI